MFAIAAQSWDRDTVRQALRRYAELCEMYRAAFVASSWPVELKSASGPRTWPARFALLASIWDLQLAVRRMTPYQQAVFHLYYSYGYSQARIGRILGCSRSKVWQMVDDMPGLVLGLLDEESASGGTEHEHSGARLRQHGHSYRPTRRQPARIGLPQGGHWV